MFAAQRHDVIMREVRLRGSVRGADLAKRLGVSELTVRRDLEELVAEGLVERVHGGARMPRQDGGQRSAATGDPRAARAPHLAPIVGMVVPSATYYYQSVVRGTEDAARRLGVRLVLAISEYDSSEERRQVERLMDLGVDGLLVTPTRLQADDDETYRVLAELPIPVVLVERTWDPTTGPSKLEFVRTDHAYGTRLAVRHLASRGHRRIALLLNEGSATSPGIIEGYREETALLGLDDDVPSMFRDPSRSNPNTVRKELSGMLDRCLKESVSAAIVHADQDALVFAQLVLDRGLRIPEDLAILAYDDEIAGLANPPLTAVSPPKSDVGHAALAQCLQRISGVLSQATQRVTMLPELVVRAST